MCVRVGESKIMYICVCYGSTDILNLSVYICICIEEILLGYFCDHLMKSCESAFSLIFLMGNFTKWKIIQYCVALWPCVSVCALVCVLCAPCVISWGRFLGTTTWSVISVLGVSTAYSVFETLRLVADGCARIFPSIL